MRHRILLAGSADSAAMLFVMLVLGGASIVLGSDSEEKAYGQENSTIILDEMRTTLQNDRLDLAEIKNMTSAEMAILREISVTSTKLATQGAYTALSVFFLGISLVIFGLRLTVKGIGHMGKYFTMMVWALTVPVVVLVAVFQFGIVTNSLVNLAETDEPFLVISFLMYIPTGIVLFLLVAQKRIIGAQATKVVSENERDLIREMDKLVGQKEKGLITDEEFQKLKTELLAKL